MSTVEQHKDKYPFSDVPDSTHPYFEVYRGDLLSFEEHQAIEQLSGEKLTSLLNELATYADHGEIGQGGSRLALSDVEKQAKDYLRDLIEHAGMTVEEHALGLVGTYAGQDNSLPAVAFGSHYDSVTRAGKYDGTTGSMAAIEVVRVLHEAGIQLRRPLKVILFTGEESTRFGASLFGSKGMLFGLDEKILDMHQANDISIREAVVEAGFQLKDVQQPVIDPTTLRAWLELHPEQGEVLEITKQPVGIVDKIAAPDRRYFHIGEETHSREPKTLHFPYQRAFKISVAGKGGHSGALPMGREFRADGLQPASTLLIGLIPFIEQDPELQGVRVFVSDLKIQGQAMNKVPGNVEFSLVLGGQSDLQIEVAHTKLEMYVQKLRTTFGSGDGEKRNHRYWEVFDPNAITVEELANHSQSTLTEKNTELTHNLLVAAHFIKAVQRIAQKYGYKKIVGTIGRVDIDNTKVKLSLDLRGLEQSNRDKAMAEILSYQQSLAIKQHVPIQVTDPLPGSDIPTELSSEVVETVKSATKEIGLPVYVMNSAAGHDTQNFQRAGIPSTMIFVTSEGGRSHVLNEYTSPEDLEKGLKVLAASVCLLAK